MAGRDERLTALFVKNVSEPGVYGDGGHGSHGLRLVVQPASGGGVRKSWVQRIRINGKATNLGLGPSWAVPLAQARETAVENHRIARGGGDPRSKAAPSLAEAVEKVIAIHAEGWKDGGKSEAQWRASLDAYVLPALGQKPVDEITTGDVLGVLLPIWSTKRETARRVRGRIGAVMKWAVAEGYRQDNPAGDAIGAALPKTAPPKQHHRALPHTEVAAAVTAVRASKALWSTKSAFEFLVLTATRSGETRGARWAEIDLEEQVWTIPAERMKSKTAHRVPLSPRALEILDEAATYADSSDLVFPSATGQIMSDGTIGKLLREAGIDAVPHGFRTSFRSWCSDNLVPRELAERALAHTVRDSTERAYARSDMLDLRRELMADWAKYISS
ncbi:tyrosine-type recombinase/integrase [Candidatus Poriferisocius sp.]|uniref:tyrosine-type recombinase/integrase n=1 Tax=Candidatus Poriferisocius sp. TaxID=3101276 RepID=UPI003B015F48